MAGSTDNRVGNMWVKNLLRLMPGKLHNHIFKIIIDRTINNNPGVCQRLKEIRGKVFRLHASDIDRSYLFYVDDGRISVEFDGKRKPDVVLQGDFDTFLKLLRHKADADSLFFSRKLTIRGDVKTSVFFKNLLEHL